jgi:hypothetical protein
MLYPLSYGGVRRVPCAVPRIAVGTSTPSGRDLNGGCCRDPGTVRLPRPAARREVLRGGIVDEEPHDGR